jgi:hypothetical protein
MLLVFLPDYPNGLDGWRRMEKTSDSYSRYEDTGLRSDKVRHLSRWVVYKLVIELEKACYGRRLTCKA